VLAQQVSAESDYQTGADVFDYKARLTDKGIADAQAAGAALKTAGILPDYFICSPYARTRETAAILAQTAGYTNANWSVDNRVRERNWGKGVFPLTEETKDQFAGDFYNSRVNGGETFGDVEVRAQQFLDHFERHQTTTTLVVTHYEFIVGLSALLQKQEMFAFNHSQQPDIANGAVIQFSCQDPSTGQEQPFYKWVRWQLDGSWQSFTRKTYSNTQLLNSINAQQQK
jgi:broad specificity phosphatase PhoE